MQEALADVGSTAKTRPAATAASATRSVTTPAPVRTVAYGRSQPGSVSSSTALRSISFSVLMTTDFGVSGTALPV